VAVCSSEGIVLGLSESGRTLLGRLGVHTEEGPFPLPESLWAVLGKVPLGSAVDWRPQRGTEGACLGCTRYGLGASYSIVLMGEVSGKHAELSRRLHQQRLEVTGRLAASIAHDVRTAVASILFNADFLSENASGLPTGEIVEMSSEIREASKRLATIVERLLAFAKLGPEVSDPIELADVVRRVSALARPIYRERRCELQWDITEEASRVIGNPLVVDQVLVNLLVNAAEASKGPILVRVTTRLAHRRGRTFVEIVVQDDGPGVPEGDPETIFQPFFTTRPEGTGLGLTTSREAARELGGDLCLEPSTEGARFVFSLPAAPAREDA
jgi:signal transduction histidine kinase